MATTPGRRSSRRLAGLSSGVNYAQSAADFDPVVTPTKPPPTHINAHQATVHPATPRSTPRRAQRSGGIDAADDQAALTGATRHFSPLTQVVLLSLCMFGQRLSQ